MFKVLISDVISAGMFVKTCEQFEEPVDYKYGRYTLDARSLMGILSCELNKPSYVEILTDDQDTISKFEKAIEKWIVEE